MSLAQIKRKVLIVTLTSNGRVVYCVNRDNLKHEYREIPIETECRLV